MSEGDGSAHVRGEWDELLPRTIADLRALFAAEKERADRAEEDQDILRRLSEGLAADALSAEEGRDRAEAEAKRLRSRIDEINEKWLPAHDEICARAERLSDDLSEAMAEAKRLREALVTIAAGSAWNPVETARWALGHCYAVKPLDWEPPAPGGKDEPMSEKALESFADFNQSADEARAELEAEGVDVDAFLERTKCLIQTLGKVRDAGARAATTRIVARLREMAAVQLDECETRTLRHAARIIEREESGT